MTLSVLLLSGCVPLPHWAGQTPPVTGILQGTSGPLAGVPVYVCQASETECCIQDEKAGSMTAADGSFSIPALFEFRMFVVMKAHAFYHWCVVADYAGQTYQSGPFMTYGLYDMGLYRQHVACTMESDAMICREALHK